jgi:hypothetical protein
MPNSSSWSLLALIKHTCIIYEQLMSEFEQKYILLISTFFEIKMTLLSDFYV